MKILLVIFILFSKFVTAEVIDINNRELSNLIEKEIKIVDVRTQNEWKSTGIIKGSILISLLDKKINLSLKIGMKTSIKKYLKMNL